MELLFDKNRQLLVHKTTRCSDFCCCHAKKNVSTAVLDLTLARCLLMNCCIGIFWYGCLDFKGVTLDQFLNSNKHILYHLWKNNTKCCKCQPDFIFPCNTSLIMESEWKKMFSSTLPPCENDRKIPVDGAVSICAFSATPSITVQEIHLELQGIIIQYCCSTRKSVEKLAELRNVTFGHVKKASMSCTEFNTFMSEAEDAILDIATVCGKEDYYRQMLLDLRDKPLDTRMFCQYEKVLLQTINNYEDIIKENEVLKDGIESLKNSNAEMKDNIERLCILQTEGSKRQRLIEQTSFEIKSHCKDELYVETKAVKHCIEMMENTNVVILSGREGCGKSRNGLEILRKLKDTHNEFDVFKLNGLQCVSNIVKCDVVHIVLFEDAFATTSPDFTSEKTILDHLYAYTSQNMMKIILLMRHTVKHKCKNILSNHRIFHDSSYIDLTTPQFQFNAAEKMEILTNFCTKNKIRIDDNSYAVSADEDSTVLSIEKTYAIRVTDPYLGFPECCRLFAEKKKLRLLGVDSFKHPPRYLVDEIEKLRMKGNNDHMKGLKYVILIYVLTICDSYGKTKISSDTKTCNDIYNECYNRKVNFQKRDIEHACEELLGLYLFKKNGIYHFNHQAIEYNVCISYSNINQKAIMPQLDLVLIKNIVRLQNYIEQEDEIVIEISKPYYGALAKEFLSLLKRNFLSMNSVHGIEMLDSKIIKDRDIDFVYQLIACIENENITKRWDMIDNIKNFFPLYFLSTLGNLENNTFTVNHTKGQLIISAVIENKSITFSVDPSISICSVVHIFGEKYDEMCKDMLNWLLQNTDHSLLNLNSILTPQSAKFLICRLQNTKYHIDMTALFIRACFKFENYSYKLDDDDNDDDNYHRVRDDEYYFGMQDSEYLWTLDDDYYYWTQNDHGSMVDFMLDNVDNSLINFSSCLLCLFRNVLDDDTWDKFETLQPEIDEYHRTLIMHILRKANLKLLNINSIAEECCKYGTIEIFKCLIQNCDHDLLHKEKLINITIDNYMPYFNMNGTYDRYDYDFNEFGEIDFNYEFDTGNYHPSSHENIIVDILLKPNMDYIDIISVMEKACKAGMYYLANFLLPKVKHELVNFTAIFEKFFSTSNVKNFYGGRTLQLGQADIFRLLLQTVNHEFIDLNRVMNAACHIGHSKAVMWLLVHTNSKQYDMRILMNKAYDWGDLKLVKYILRTYSFEHSDYQSLLSKACQVSKKKRFATAIRELLWKTGIHN